MKFSMIMGQKKGDTWYTISKQGTAMRPSSPDGVEKFNKLQPDGSWKG